MRSRRVVLRAPGRVRHKDQMPVPSPYLIVLSAEEEAVLAAGARSVRSQYRDRLRAQIVLAAAAGMNNAAIAGQLGVHVDTVRKWRRRFAGPGVAGVRGPGGGGGESPPRRGVPAGVPPPTGPSTTTNAAPGLPGRLGRPPRAGVWPVRAHHRDRTVLPAGQAGDDRRALRQRGPGVLDRPQRLPPTAAPPQSPGWARPGRTR